MLKGINKNIIVINPPKKSSFEKIFFIVKVSHAPRSSDDMLTEANRLIGDNLTPRGLSQARARRKSLIFFFLGALSGALAVGLIFLIAK